jgi:hypothetical protein
MADQKKSVDPILIGYIVTMIIQYGLPAVFSILTEWAKADPGMSDLEALKSIPIDPDA